MRAFLQNLFSVFRLYSWATILNIVGLSVAFAVMYVIVRQSWYEFSFDKHYPEHELIYRVEYGSDKHSSDNFERPRLAPRLSASPYVKESGMCYMFATDANIYTLNSFTNGYAAKALRINKGYTDVFSFEWVSGNISRFDLSDKNIIIPASMAKKIFGTIDAAGKQIRMQFDIYNLGDVYDDYNIVAVYEDFPENSTVFNGVYVSLANFMEDVWHNAGFRGYVKVNKKENVKIIEDAMSLSGVLDESKDDGRNIKLFPMDDIYFHSRTDSRYDMGTLAKRGDIRFTWLLLSFALLVISVAMINFSNFSMALAPGRIKSFNTQKVLGASLWSLRFQYLMECVAISFIAFLISLFIVQIAIMCGISKLFIIDVSLGGGASIVVFCAIVAIIIGLVVGIYPAVYMTSVPAAMALKGSFRLSPKGLYFRNLLIGFQFTVTFVFLII
ncbi:MAG: ABC transporter permease, partial [Bacteroidaceae bacterium]|nr:ABC transporter permease [Bacteroidaceae bacterium]